MKDHKYCYKCKKKKNLKENICSTCGCVLNKTYKIKNIIIALAISSIIVYSFHLISTNYFSYDNKTFFYIVMLIILFLLFSYSLTILINGKHIDYWFFFPIILFSFIVELTQDPINDSLEPGDYLFEYSLKEKVCNDNLMAKILFISTNISYLAIWLLIFFEVNTNNLDFTYFMLLIVLIIIGAAFPMAYVLCDAIIKNKKNQNINNKKKQ